MRTRLLLACSLFSLAAYLRMRHGSSTLAELRLASPARAPPTKFLVLMMKGRVGSVWLRDLLMAASAATSTGATRRDVRLFS